MTHPSEPSGPTKIRAINPMRLSSGSSMRAPRTATFVKKLNIAVLPRRRSAERLGVALVLDGVFGLFGFLADVFGAPAQAVPTSCPV